MNKMILDGCTAATHVAYAMSDVATIYPITPVASMGQTAQQWGLEGRLNLMGQHLEVREMESELGAAGAAHGAASAGALVSTFTASQGLLLMIPNMFKIAGELLPVVFHVGCRSVASHALSIFGDHQDVMACRMTGVAMLASSSVQETMDLAIVAHLAAIEGSLPVIHFFDGWRTSSEMNTIDVIDYESIGGLVDWDKVKAFRRRGLNPEHPRVHGSAQNPDVFFQNSEAANKYYDRFPSIVQSAMDKVAEITGRQHKIVEYYGDENADRIIVIMASGAEVVRETVDYLNHENGYKVGLIKVLLYRPFPASQIADIIPTTVKSIAVLDRTKESGAQHEPLCLDVISAIHGRRDDIRVTGGRYGLSSKEFNPSMVKAIFDYLGTDKLKDSFTIGINDDVTNLSLQVVKHIDTGRSVEGLYKAVFYGIGNDGTVGGTKQTAAIIGNRDGLYAQAYFNYSAKKSGGYTISQLRIGREPITSSYSITDADYVACHKASYVRRFAMLDKIADNGIFVINCRWSDGDLISELPLDMRRTISAKKIRLFTIDADKIAAEVGLAPRINMPMETVFLYLSKVVPFRQGYESILDSIRKTYKHEDNKVVEQNLKAVSMAVGMLHETDYLSINGWATAPERQNIFFAPDYIDKCQRDFIEKVHSPCMHGQGDRIPVSAFSPDGFMPMGTTAFEHRRVATIVPVWDPDKCVECTECSLVCPHAAIRPFILSQAETEKAPEEFVTKEVLGSDSLKGFRFRIQNYPADCLGCSSCSLICPGHALTMTPIDEVFDRELPLAIWARENVSVKSDLVQPVTIRGTQLQQPMLEFSGACAGCGETPYIKLLTQLFGTRLIIANATGCSSVWGADFPSNPYCTDSKGHGPAWGNSLFEDNAEYGFGIHIAILHRRKKLESLVRQMIGSTEVQPYIKSALEAWLTAKDSVDDSRIIGRQIIDMLTPLASTNTNYETLLDYADLFGKKSVWSVGGDGWAYDIGFAGLDHVLASGEKVKILVLDTECYSNTGGQTSKATPRSCVAKYSPDGKDTPKKDLGRMMMTYGYVYVASIALGANYQQAIDAIIEAENYPGPAIVIAYCPCLNHGIRPGLGHSIVEQRRAVEAGYWPLYRFNPIAYKKGESGLSVDSVIPGPDNSGTNGSSPQSTSQSFNTKEPLTDVRQYIGCENRYADLQMISPTRAAILQPLLQTDCLRTNNELNK